MYLINQRPFDENGQAVDLQPPVHGYGIGQLNQEGSTCAADSRGEPCGPGDDVVARDQCR